MTTPALSICIATYCRAGSIAETLDSIVAQWTPDLEIVVVDGASPDDTQQVVGTYVRRFPAIRYYREAENSGVDRGYDKAVSYAKGRFCWLMTDDDLVKPGAVARVRDALNRELDLIVVNAEVRNSDFSKELEKRLLGSGEDRTYTRLDRNRFFSDAAACLSFIGSVIVRRDFWIARERASYYGSLFIHVGVIFQTPVPDKVLVIADPLITIRYGVAMWTPRWFEIWMVKWPQLIWSFQDIADSAKAAVCPKEPWTQIKRLFFCRAIGAYTRAEYERFIFKGATRFQRAVYLGVALFPGRLANLLAAIYFLALKRQARTSIFGLSHSRYATWGARLAARLIDV